MGRPLSSTMDDILALPKRDIQWTIDITFPDTSIFRFATAPLELPKGSYTNDLESVSEIRQSIEAPADNVSIGLQNKDRVLGLHIAAYWQQWRKAEAVVGRYYRDRRDSPTLEEWMEMFRGSVQQPDANDLRVTFDIIPDSLTPGEIVCNRTLAAPCWFVFKDPKTCSYVGSGTVCDHHLKSSAGCDGYLNSHHFGGMEHRYNPDFAIPGTGGNPGGGDDGGGGPVCPRLDQYVAVKGPDGRKTSKMVCFFTEEDELWNPFLRQFRPTKSTRIIKDQPIWELLTANGALGFSSFLHPIIRDLHDRIGEPVRDFIRHQSLVTVFGEVLITSKTVWSRETGQTSDVMKIEMEGDVAEEKIYCYGDNPDKLIACHNAKNEA